MIVYTKLYIHMILKSIFLIIKVMDAHYGKFTKCKSVNQRKSVNFCVCFISCVVNYKTFY